MRSSLERINPDNIDEEINQDETLKLHIERYLFAGKFLTKGNIADVACGTGYGSYLLATRFTGKVGHIISIDNHHESIEAACTRFRHPKIEFVEQDATRFKSSIPLNNIVSLETIEHLPCPKQFIIHFANQLSAGGRFIASVPVTPSMDANPYHLHDFTIKRFEKMFENAGLDKIHSEIQMQRFRPLQVLSGNEKAAAGIRRNLGRYYFHHPSKLWLRIRSTLTDGFVNKYLLVVYQKD